MFRNLFYFPSQGSTQTFLIIALTVWSLIWKGLALWRAARKRQKYWYIAMLVLNTVGVLEIVYLVFFQKGKEKTKDQIKQRTNKKSK